MFNNISPIDFDTIALGDHLCSIYQNKEQQFVPVVPFMKAGLDHHQKCFYIADECSSGEVVAELKKGGIEIEKFIASGQFVILTKKETYLRSGAFDPDKMIEFLKETEKDALKDGYTGMRATGEMTWMLENISDNSKLLEYEARLNDFLPASRSAYICQYNENKFKPEVLTAIIHTHPLLIIYGKLYRNLYFYFPAQYTKRDTISPLVNLYKRMLNDIIKSD
jgi:hypothetical protein